MRYIMRGFDGLQEMYFASMAPERAHDAAQGMSREPGTMYLVDQGAGGVVRYVGGRRLA